MRKRSHLWFLLYINQITITYLSCCPVKYLNTFNIRLTTQTQPCCPDKIVLILRIFLLEKMWNMQKSENKKMCYAVECIMKNLDMSPCTSMWAVSIRDSTNACLCRSTIKPKESFEVLYLYLLGLRWAFDATGQHSSYQSLSSRAGCLETSTNRVGVSELHLSLGPCCWEQTRHFQTPQPCPIVARWKSSLVGGRGLLSISELSHGGFRTSSRYLCHTSWYINQEKDKWLHREGFVYEDTL